MSTSGVGKLTCLTNTTINWGIPSFHLLPTHENTHIWSPVFVYYYKYTSYAVPRIKMFLDTPKKSLALIITSCDVKYNQIKHVQVGLTDEINNVVINRCDGVWIEQAGGIRYIKVIDIVNEETLRPVLNQRTSNEIHLRFFCIALNNQQHQKVNASILRDEEHGISISAATASSVSSTAAANIKENWRCRLCTLINPVHASNCEACNLPKSIKDKNLGSSEKLISPISNPAIPTTNLPLCIICISKERNIAFQPCGHLITCSDCADFRMKCCPLCRKDIQNKLKTFIN